MTRKRSARATAITPSFCDLERHTVEHVAAVRAVAMDMWDPYIRATREGLPAGADTIVFDRFHIMQEMNTAVDLVRKQEHRALRRADGAPVLTGSKYLSLYGQERVPAKHAERFAQLGARGLQVGRAWAIKEALRTLWTHRRHWAAARFFRRWFHKARCSRVEPVRRSAATLKRHAEGLRVSQSAELPDRDLFSLWGTRSLPTPNPEAP